MDEEQDFAYAVSEKALRHIAETAGREVPGVVAIRSRSVSGLSCPAAGSRCD